MSLFGLFIAVFIGIGLVSKEVEKRSIYALLAKPIRRQELIIGKYLGLVLTLARESRGDGRRLLRRARRRRVDRRRVVPAALGSACGRSGAAEGGRDDLPAARDRDGSGAFVLDLLEPDALRGADVRSLRRRALQRGPQKFRSGRRSRSRSCTWLARSTICCRTSRRSTSRARSCTRCRFPPATCC